MNDASRPTRGGMHRSRSPRGDRTGLAGGHPSVALLSFLRDLEHSLPRDCDMNDAMPDGFEATVRENIRVALKAMA
jgi:hypothetical protein